MQIKEMIEKIVQGDVILMSTNCVRKELKFLGVTCNRALSFSNRQCDTANCHDRPIVAPPLQVHIHNYRGRQPRPLLGVHA